MLLAVILALAVPAFFVAVWAGTTFLAGTLSGWRALGGPYRVQDAFDGPLRRTNQNAWLGWLGYGWSLHVGVSGDHLRLDVSPLFRFGHPPLAIPLGDVSVSLEPWVLGERAVFRFAEAPGVRLKTYPALARELAEMSGGRLVVA